MVDRKISVKHAGQLRHGAGTDSIVYQYSGSLDDTFFLFSVKEMDIGGAFLYGAFEPIGRARFEKGDHIVFLNSGGIPIIILKQVRP